MNLNKKELAKIVSKKAKIRQEDTANIISLFLEEIVKQFQAGNTIELREFGTFFPLFIKPRTYVIPRLKKEHTFKGHTVLKFKPSKRIRLYEE